MTEIDVEALRNRWSNGLPVDVHALLDAIESLQAKLTGEPSEAEVNAAAKSFYAIPPDEIPYTGLVKARRALTAARQAGG